MASRLQIQCFSRDETRFWHPTRQARPEARRPLPTAAVAPRPVQPHATSGWDPHCYLPSARTPRQLTRFSRPRHSRSRRTYFCTLPVEVFGSGPNSTASGALKWASRSRQKSISSALGHVLVRAQRDERLRTLPPLLVREGDNSAFEHRRMAADRVLDLDRGDVLAAGDDDVLLAVADFDVAVGVPDAEVAAVKPAAGERGGGGVGRLEVALHDVVAAHHHLAEGDAVAGHVGHLVVDHADRIGDDVVHALAPQPLRPRLIVE